LNCWSDEKGNRVKKTTSKVDKSDIPDFVIFKGESWGLTDGDRKRILIDIDLKVEFNPENVIQSGGNVRSAYPGDTRKGYVQLLRRANRAITNGAITYYAILTDFASITFFKMSNLDQYLKVAYGPLPFGGVWNGRSLSFNTEQPVPIGFKYLVSLIFKREEHNNLSVVNEEKSKQYVIDKLIGRGKHSVVFIVHDFSGSYCLKIERISLSTQIHNEVDNLKKTFWMSWCTKTYLSW